MTRNANGEHDGDKRDGPTASHSKRRHQDDQDRHELRRRGEGQRGRGSALHVKLDLERAPLAIRRHSDGSVVVDISAVLCAIDTAPTWYEWLADHVETDKQVTIAEGAELLGMSPDALRLRVWRARKREEWSPYYQSGPSATLVASKRELLAWRETWTGHRRQRGRTPGDLTRPA
jgi:hypothetical protein